MNGEKSKIHFVIVAGLSADNKEALGFKDILERDGYGAEAISFYGEKYVDDFTGMKIDECIRNVSAIIDRAAEKYEYVYGVGISLGGSLLLEHAKKSGNLDGIASIGTPVKLKKRLLVTFVQKIYPFVYPIWRRLQKIKKLRLMPIGAGNMVIEYIEKDFVKNLDSVKTPTLLLHSKKDDVSDYRVMPRFLEKISSEKKQIRFFNNGRHVIDEDLFAVVNNILEFFKLRQDSLAESAIIYSSDLTLESQSINNN
jgi:esterase/lipase